MVRDLARVRRTPLEAHFEEVFCNPTKRHNNDCYSTRKDPWGLFRDTGQHLSLLQVLERERFRQVGKKCFWGKYSLSAQGARV